jgi:hypothetical protein
LFQILVLFAATEKISERYRLNAQTRDDLSILSTDDIAPAILSLSNKIKALTIKRQKETSILKTASWALYHISELEKAPLRHYLTYR